MTLSVAERSRLIQGIQAELSLGRIGLGDAVKRLRQEVTGLRQDQFARMCKISVRTLAHIENGEGNQTLKSLNAVFKPFGLEMGVVAVNTTLV